MSFNIGFSKLARAILLVYFLVFHFHPLCLLTTCFSLSEKGLSEQEKKASLYVRNEVFSGLLFPLFYDHLSILSIFQTQFRIDIIKKSHNCMKGQERALLSRRSLLKSIKKFYNKKGKKLSIFSRRTSRISGKMENYSFYKTLE